MPRSRRAAKPAVVRLSAPHFEPLDLDAWAGSVVSHAGRKAALDQPEPGQDLVSAAASQRPDVPCDGGQRDSLPRPGQQAGRADYRGPSNSRVMSGRGAGISRGMWHAVGGGESGWATPDPTDPNIIWSSSSGSGMRGGIVTRFEESRRQFRCVEVWPDQSNGPAEGVRYRFIWDAPLDISPHDHNTVYVGSQHVHRTRDGGQSWQVISPDLTLNDRSRMKSSGGLTGDNIGVEYAGTVYAIAESPKDKGTIWVGTNDGLVQLTRDDGATWTNLTRNLPGSR